MTIITPKTLKGFRDFLPSQQIARQKMIEIIKKTYESFGFSPLETPALEYSEILLGKYGEEGDKLLYRFRDNGDRDVALRYDLTIPLARVSAQYPELKKPFKRYQIAPVWRAENTQKGRFREFYQCDADIIGTASMLADSEIIFLIYKTLTNLGVSDFLIKINNRKILNGFYEALGIKSEDKIKIIRIVDKLDKIAAKGVSEELAQAGFNSQTINEVLEFSSLQIETTDSLDRLEKKYPQTKEGIDELKATIAAVKHFGLDKNFYKIDLAIARGLDYYTGTVFETQLKKLPGFGSVFSGGRYDKLVGIFSNTDIPAVGASIGIDRLFAALDELGLIKTKKSTSDVLLTFLDNNLLPDYLKITTKLREAGLNVFFYFEPSNLGKQLKFAAETDIPLALIYGSDEKQKDQILVKNLTAKTQEEISLNQLPELLLKNKRQSYPI